LDLNLTDQSDAIRLAHFFYNYVELIGMMKSKFAPSLSYNSQYFKSFVKKEHPHSLNSQSKKSKPSKGQPPHDSPNRAANEEVMDASEVAEMTRNTSAHKVQYFLPIVRVYVLVIKSQINHFIQKENVALYKIDDTYAVVKRLASRHELEILQELGSKRAKNIVQIITTVSEQSPHPVIAMHRLDPMPYCNFTVDQCLAYGYQLSDVVDFIHSLFICHLDIKPQNILIHGAKQELVLTDFGLSVRVRDLEATVKGARGTPGWVAPELDIPAHRVGDESHIRPSEIEMNADVVFSPFAADNWAVGAVLKWMAKVPPVADVRLDFLSNIGKELSHEEVKQRLGISQARLRIGRILEISTAESMVDSAS
jgi:serine/threonine protein kinase